MASSSPQQKNMKKNHILVSPYSHYHWNPGPKREFKMYILWSFQTCHCYASKIHTKTHLPNFISKLHKSYPFKTCCKNPIQKCYNKSVFPSTYSRKEEMKHQWRNPVQSLTSFIAMFLWQLVAISGGKNTKKAGDQCSKKTRIKRERETKKLRSKGAG